MSILFTIHWVPELGIYKVSDGRRDRVVTPAEFAPGGKLENLAEVFSQAREAVESGCAVLGINVEVPA